jgi:hypothetical protein
VDAVGLAQVHVVAAITGNVSHTTCPRPRRRYERIIVRARSTYSATHAASQQTRSAPAAVVIGQRVEGQAGRGSALGQATEPADVPSV